MFPANLHKKAVCVGISYKNQPGPYNVPPEDFELAGSHNDVWRVIGLLTGHYGYEKENITVLLDADGYTQPTRENIMSAINRLMDEARPGENLFFFFAGHGDQITNLDGTEDDNKDEIILPLDWQLDEERPVDDRERYSQIIIDDDLNNILVKRLPSGCRLTALFDSCHSGTLLDLPYTRFYGPRSKSPPKDACIIDATIRTSSPTPETSIVLDSQHVAYSLPRSLSDPPLRPPRRSPLELSYYAAVINPRGRKDPNWRKGTWLIRGETLDDRINATQPFEGLQAISWSACSDGQNGYETISKSTHENLSGGVMVKAFVGILEIQPYRTYGDILKCLGERLRIACCKINKHKKNMDQWIMQEPQLGSQRKPNLEELFAP